MKVFKVFVKPFEAPQRIVKIKNQVNFFYLPGIGTGRVNFVDTKGKSVSVISLGVLNSGIVANFW